MAFHTNVNLTVLLLNRKSQKFVSLNVHMHGRKMLKQVQKVEDVGCISRQLSMLLAFMVIKTFVNTAKISCCDRRTVAM